MGNTLSKKSVTSAHQRCKSLGRRSWNEARKASVKERYQRLTFAAMHRFNSPGKTMEESLEEVLNATDANLASLERKKRAAQAAPPITRSQYIEAKRLLTPDLYQTSNRARPSSAPRGAYLSYGRVVAFEDEGNFEQKSEETIDRRFDAFLRKQKLMEDRLKKLETQKNAEAQAADQLREENVKLQEDQKLDHKLIHSLKSQLSSLKTKVDLIVSNEEQREAKMVQSEHNIHAHITHTLKSPCDSHHTELSHQIAEIVRLQVAKALETQVVSPTGLNTTINTHNNPLNSSQVFSRTVNVDQVTSLEKEVIRLSAECDRTKQRLSVLDAAYNELKNTTTLREMKNEEHSKKVVNSYRVEVETFLSSAARRTADALTSIHANTLDITTLRSDLDNFIDRTGTVLAELDTKLSQHESSIEEIYTVLERVELGIHTLKHTSQDHDNNILRFVEDSVLLAKVSGAVESHTRTLAVHHERLEHVDMQVSANSSAIESHSVPIDILAKSIDSINDKFETRTDTLHSTITANQEATSASLHTIQETHKRTRGKVRELTESMKTISTIRTSIESVLQEVDSRAKQDASWTYTFKSGMQRLENRLGYVEKLINPAGLPYCSDSVDSTGDNNDKASTQPLPAAASSVPLHTTQFDELRALITEFRGELLHTQREENTVLRDNVQDLLEQRIAQLEERCQQLVDEARQHAEEYTEEQLQSSLDYLHNTLDTLHNNLSDVHTLFDGLSHDVDALGDSLREQVTGVDAEVNALKEKVLVVEDRVSNVSSACESGLSVLQGQVNDVLDLPERVSKLETICQSSIDGESVSLVSLSAQVVMLQQEITTLSETVSTHDVSLNTLQDNLDNQYMDLTERIENCDSTSTTLAARVKENHEFLLDEISAVTDNVNEMSVQVKKVRERESALLAPVLEEISVLKEDLSSHISFTNNCIADLQTALEENSEAGKAAVAQQMEEVKEVLQGKVQDVQTALEGRLDAAVERHQHQLNDLGNELQQYDASLRTALLDQHTTHNTSTAALHSTLAELNTALSNQDNVSKSKIGALEKRLAAQEGSVRERIVSLEVKLSTVEDSLRSHIASMAGTLHSQTLQLASQSEQLQHSIPLSTKEQLDQQLANTLTHNITTTMTEMLTESCDKLKAQIIVLRERLEETENKLAGQETDTTAAVDTLNARLDTFHTTLTAYVDDSVNTVNLTQENALTALTNDVLSTVDDRNNSIRELVYQLHKLVGTQQDEYISTINTITSQISTLETSITSTDQLLSEHVNDSEVNHTALLESVNSKCSIDDVESIVAPLMMTLVTPQLAQLQETLTSELTLSKDTVTALSNTVNTIEADLVRRCNHMEHAQGNVLNDVNDHFAELETRCDVLENDTTRQIDTLHTTIGTLDNKVAEYQSASLRVSSDLQEGLKGKITAVEESLTSKNDDHAQLLQLYEKRLRTVEKAIDTRVQEVLQQSHDAHAALQTRLNEVSAGLERGGKENKECVNSLTLQLLSIQNQLNDHTDEVRTQIENEIVLLREQLNRELSTRADATTRAEHGSEEGSSRLEEWVTRLQASHEDHLGLFESTLQAQEERFKVIESDLTGLDASLTSLHRASADANSAHNSTLLELHNEFAEHFEHTKARLTSVEQRAIRSEASNKEKFAELSSQLVDSCNSTHTTLAHTQTQLSQLKSELSSQQALLTSLEGSSGAVSQVVTRMDELEQKIAQNNVHVGEKIDAMEAYVKEQVEAVQVKMVPVEHTSGAVKAEHSGAKKSAEETETSTSAADLSHISRVTISPVRKHHKHAHSHHPVSDPQNTVRSSTSSDMLNQTVRLHLHEQDDDVLLGSRELYGASSGGVDLVYESDNEEEERRRGDKGDEREAVGADDRVGGESLQQFNSMIETVNFDIATLGSHLKSFQADVGQDAAARRAAQEFQAEQTRERQDQERQAAVENLQLKKFNHRRKFQRALFENKD